MANKTKILNVFLNPLTNVIDNLPRIKEANFDGVQICPIQPCKSLSVDDTMRRDYNWWNMIYHEWWKLYQPFDLSIAETRNQNFLGTKDEFIELCERAHKLDLKVVVDVVLRHLAGDDKGNLIPHPNCSQELVSYKEYWPEQIKIMDYENRQQVIHGSMAGLPSLDYNNENLQREYYLPFLEEILRYADGLRLDMAKHFSLPSEGGTFWQNVIQKLPENKLIYGELMWLKDERLIEEYHRYILPLLHNYEWLEYNAVRYIESHDLLYHFKQRDGVQGYQRLNEWKKLLQDRTSIACLYFARRNDETIFSEEMKRVNGKY